MAVHDTVETVPTDRSDRAVGPIGDEITPYEVNDVTANMDEERVERDPNMTEKDLLDAKAVAGQMGTEEVRVLMGNVLDLHKHDPNLPHVTLEKIKEFLGNEAVFDNPEKHEDLIYEMKLEAALITNNSPYAEVRAVVDNHDDSTMLSSTIRAWVIGLAFSASLASSSCSSRCSGTTRAWSGGATRSRQAEDAAARGDLWAAGGVLALRDHLRKPRGELDIESG